MWPRRERDGSCNNFGGEIVKNVEKKPGPNIEHIEGEVDVNNNNNNNNHDSTALYGFGPPLSEVTRSLCICGSEGPAHWPRCE
jgi:hypothetical protein